MSASPSPLIDQRTINKEELAIHYDQLKTLDENLYRYSSVFFTINAALLAFLAQFLTADKQSPDPIVYLFIGFLGYTSSACMFLIGYKGHYTWELKSERVRQLERALGYLIDETYQQSLARRPYWAARLLSISGTRLLLNALLAFLWFVLLVAFPYLTKTPLTLLLVCLSYPVISVLLVAIPLSIIWGARLLGRTSKDDV